ncbi:protein FAM131C [Tachyglossus aculeatus]|uniref:protein FAM131C n=1 Tax=Tachyglossus aculeatus TaxID=9261 RepID=UPI0018F7C060|nr:protein FAM131C [Tachyglossus aculeatus]
MGSCVSSEFVSRVHKDYSMPGCVAHPTPGTPICCLPPATPPPLSGKEKRMDFCWDPWQRCFKTSNLILSESQSCSGNYNVAALATSSLVGVVQSIKDHITKPTAMARGRVAHLIEWKGWSAPGAGWAPSPAEEEHYCHLPDELREARFAAGVAEQFAITEATLSAWSSLDDDAMLYGDRYGDHYRDHAQDAIQLQDLENNFLQDSLQSGPQRQGNSTLHSSLQAFSSSLNSPLPQAHPLTGEWDLCQGPLAGLEHQISQPEGLEKQEWQSESAPPLAPVDSGDVQLPLTSFLRYVDSSSLSEDEVFYN